MKKIAADVYYVGVNDRQKNLFENLWPLPYGISYNSFLIVDEKTALIDTVDIAYVDLFLKKIEEVLGGKNLDFLVINHMEPDHAGSIGLLRQRYPEMKIVGNKQTFRMLEGYHHITEGTYEVKEGETLSLGKHQLTFYMTSMVHWPEVMMAYEDREKILFSADAFGTYGTLDGGLLDSEMNVSKYWDEMLRYYANIVGKYGNPVQKALQKLSKLDIGTICPTHGPVWRQFKNSAIQIYDRLSRYDADTGVTLIFGSMYGNTEQMAETIADSLAANGIQNIAMHHVSKSPSSYILKDIFTYQGVIIGSPTYSGQLYPEIDAILNKIEVREIPHRLYGYFGSFTWAGVATKMLGAFGEKMKWELVSEPVEQKQAMDAQSYEKCMLLGKQMADQLKKN